jgi:hypothetical protein
MKKDLVSNDTYVALSTEIKFCLCIIHMYEYMKVFHRYMLLDDRKIVNSFKEFFRKIY